MSADDYQKAWRAESEQTRVTVDPELLRMKVQQAHQEFRAMILMRDIREVVVALVMIPLWLYFGSVTSQPWTWYLTVPALLWIMGFIIIDRLRHKQRTGLPGDSLVESAAESMRQVEHQIWLLRNVFWWYLLPCTIGLLVYFTHVALLASQSWIGAIGATALPTLFVIALYYFVYYLNQHAVRTQLEPRRRELIAILASLEDDTLGGVHGEFPLLTGRHSKPCSRWKLVVASLSGVALFLTGVGAFIHLARLDDGHAKLAPFTDVRWGGDSPMVEIDGDWYLLLSIDELDVKAIVAFCQETYGGKWRKRFGEDLVQVLTEMGHRPGNTVRLDLHSVGPDGERRVRDVAMTAENRRKVWAAGAKREAAAPGGESAGASGPTTPFGEELEGVRATYRLPAMAAFALRGDTIVEQAVVGTLSTKDDTPVGAEGQWHLGSNTKAMTATVAGMLVEQGLLRWDSTIGEVIGERVPTFDPAHRDTTLAMLFHHTSGIAANINWFSAPEDRVACAAEILARPPDGARGEYAYSNAGYVVAGAMMEVVTGKRWEELMKEKLFVPLGMTNTGFGPPARPGSPWGHASGLLGWKALAPATRGSDNPPVMGPAGTVHTTMVDYSRFVAAHLKGAQGVGGIVSAETFAALHTPDGGGDYGMGWIVTEREWAGGRVLTHGGSNTLWFVTVWIAPEKDMAFFAATNAGGDDAFQAVDLAVSLLIERFVAGGPSRAGSGG